jgi:hypothetical protein
MYNLPHFFACYEFLVEVDWGEGCKPYSYTLAPISFR